HEKPTRCAFSKRKRFRNSFHSSGTTTTNQSILSSPSEPNKDTESVLLEFAEDLPILFSPDQCQDDNGDDANEEEAILKILQDSACIDMYEEEKDKFELPPMTLCRNTSGWSIGEMI